MCRLLFQPNTTAGDLLITPTSEPGEVKSVLFGCNKKLKAVGRDAAEFPVAALKLLIRSQHSTHCNTQCYEPGLTRLK